MKIQLALATLVLALSPSAFAQQRGGGQNAGRGGQNGGVLQLPKGVDRVISIDAYNTLLAQTTDDDGNRDYTPIIVRHVYSGGIAALFGGTSIPTEVFVSPGGSNGGGGGNNRNGGGSPFGVQGVGGGGNNNFGGGGGNNFGGGGNNFGGGGNNFGGGGGNFSGVGNFNNGGNFNGGGNFGGVTGVNGAGINQGFNGAGNGQIFTARNGNIGFGQTSVVNPNGTTTPIANGPFFVR